jgi:hypothetical protein
MAMKAASGQKDSGSKRAGRHDVEVAINKTRGLAFSRAHEHEAWQPIDIKGVADLDEMERVSHTKIGENWFSVFRAAHGKR